MYISKLFKGNKLKKIISLALTISMLMTATACGKAAEADGQADAPGDNSITVAVITKDAYLETAVKLFQERHPGVTVNVEEYTSEPLPKADGKNMVIKKMEKAEDVEKYKNAVNTQLMSGKGPDIMLLSPLPYENYIDKNMLVNLSEMIETDKSFNVEDYYTNILDAMKYKGGLYGFPTSVTLDVLQGNSDILDKYGIDIEEDKWTWGDFENMAEAIRDKSSKDGVEGVYALAGMDGSSLITSLVSRSYSSFVDKAAKTAGFDSAEFIAMLNMAKGMFDKGYINTEQSKEKMMDLAARGNTLFGVSNIRNFLDLMMAKQIYGDNVKFLKYPGAGQDQAFEVNSLYGINVKSPDRELSWEFLKFLNSEELTAQAGLVGLSVNKAASKAEAQKAIEMSNNIASGKAKIALNNNGQGVILNKQITEEDVKMVQELLAKANKYNEMDRQIVTILQEETKAFFEGSKTAEATAGAIQDRVNIYINE